MQESALLGRRKHGNRVCGTGRAEIRSFERIDGDVDLVETHGFRAGDVLRVHHADFFADVEHRRFVALALADDDRPADVQRVERLAHGVDRRLIRALFVAAAHQARRSHRRRLGEADRLQADVAIHHDW